jgi:hypothetical protein
MPGDAPPIHALFVVSGGANGSRDVAAITQRLTARAATATGPVDYKYPENERLRRFSASTTFRRARFWL